MSISEKNMPEIVVELNLTVILTYIIVTVPCAVIVGLMKSSEKTQIQTNLCLDTLIVTLRDFLFLFYTHFILKQLPVLDLP